MALDALRTPPSASLAATILHPAAHIQYSMRAPATNPSSGYILQSSANDDYSSSDKENTPPHPNQRPDQASKASTGMKTILQCSPTKQHMSFTPQRIRPPPRAWERRPATPYVSRNEGQKIWKRVPLQELGIEVNHGPSTKEKAEKENYLRVVKRMRLDDETNASISIDNLETRSALVTKWGEDHIEQDGSPKKKQRAEKQATVVAIENAIDLNKNALDGLTDIDGNHLATKVIVAASENGQPLLKARDCVVEDTEINLDHALHTSIDPDNIRNVEDAFGAGISMQGFERSRIVEQDDAVVSPKDDCTNGGVAEIGLNADENSGTVNKDSVLGRPNKAIEEPAAASEFQANTSTPSATESDMNNDCRIVEAAAAPVCNNDPLPEETYVPDSETSPTNTSVNTGGARAPNAFSSSDQEETAFLRDFLERAQASKAAKVAISPQKRHAPFLERSEQHITDVSKTFDAEATDDIEDDDLSLPGQNVHIQQMSTSDNSKTSSPTRRSARTASRAAASRLPRFQMSSTPQSALPLPQNASALPSTIQLKRATGSEFIFNAKSQQNLAMITKSNTKRNQGDAIHVGQRLAQLKKASEIQQQEGLGSHDGQNPVEEDVRCKKRKRDRQMDVKSSSVKRNVWWPSDELLAKYREPTPSLDELEVAEIPKEVVPASTNTSEESDSQMPLDDAKACNEPKQSDASEDLSKLKVRRIRKIKLESVNGTPAPKTRSRSLSESSLVEESATAAAPSIEPPTSISNTRKSSRMPVPISTPIPLPAFTTARTRTKALEKDKDKSEAKVLAPILREPDSLSTPEKTTTKSADPSRRIDGRRRLRDRG